MFEALARRLAAIPLPLVAALLLVGAVLADIHVALPKDWMAPADGSTGGETPQWIGRTTVMTYYLFLPVGVLALWARRAESLGKAGKVAAALVAPQIPAYLVITVAAVLYGLVLDKGDVPGVVAALEVFVSTFYLGLIVLAVAWMLDRGAIRVIGALLLAGLVVSFVMPFLLTAVFVVLAVVVVTRGVSRSADVQAHAAAH